MSRSTEFNYDQEKWELYHKNSQDNHYSDDTGLITTYFLKEKSTSIEYQLNPYDIQYQNVTSDNNYIDGIEQISDHEFLMYSHHSGKCYIHRHILKPDIVNISHQYTAKHLYSLTDDTIWLGDWEIYSISKDCIIDSLIYFKDNTEISLKFKENEKIFYCKKYIQCSESEVDYLLFKMNAETFEPDLAVFSTLRNNFINLSDYSSLEDLISEELEYKKYIVSYFSTLKNSSIKNAEDTILSGFSDEPKN